MKKLYFAALLAASASFAAEIEVSSLADLADAAAKDGQQIRLKPGVSSMKK